VRKTAEMRGKWSELGGEERTKNDGRWMRTSEASCRPRSMTAMVTRDQKRTSDWPEKTQNVRKARKRWVEKTVRLNLQSRSWSAEDEGNRGGRRRREREETTSRTGV